MVDQKSYLLTYSTLLESCHSTEQIVKRCSLEPHNFIVLVFLQNWMEGGVE